jgi:hypothetical protein
MMLDNARGIFEICDCEIDCFSFVSACFMALFSPKPNERNLFHLVSACFTETRGSLSEMKHSDPATVLQAVKSVTTVTH